MPEHQSEDAPFGPTPGRPIPEHQSEQEYSDPRPCKGGNSNICVAEGCYGEACRQAYRTGLPSGHELVGQACTCGWTPALGTSVSREFDRHLLEVRDS